MHKLVAKSFSANTHSQLSAVHPVDLQALARTVLLREKQLRFAAEAILPPPHSPLETAPLSRTELLPMLSQKLLPECLGNSNAAPDQASFPSPATPSQTHLDACAIPVAASAPADPVPHRYTSIPSCGPPRLLPRSDQSCLSFHTPSSACCVVAD
jgi:hypothetical protein